MSTGISPAAQRYVDAVNAFDIDAVLATFAHDANSAASPRKWPFRHPSAIGGEIPPRSVRLCNIDLNL
jgi:hypothetical protein